MTFILPLANIIVDATPYIMKSHCSMTLTFSQDSWMEKIKAAFIFLKEDFIFSDGNYQSSEKSNFLFW